MSSAVKRSRGLASPAWVLPLALVALPDCGFTHGVGVSPFTPSIPPGTTLVFCDLRMEDPEPVCSAGIDLRGAVRRTEAAVALVQGAAESRFAVDDSPETRWRCGGPEGIEFNGSFPTGTNVCVDPASIGPGLTFATSTEVCVHKCLDLKFASDADASALAFCEARAVPSTNVPSDPNVLFANGCDANGMPLPGFADPRREGEPVDWVNTVGVDPSGGNLVRSAACDPLNGCAFDAGAASARPATHGDGYLEFTVNETTANRIIGLTTGAGADDQDLTFQSIGFALDFFRDGCIYLYENGQPRAPGTPVDSAGCLVQANTFGHYAPGDRFRISFIDQQDGTAKINYGKLNGPCSPGQACPAPPIYISGVPATYPLHVDASFYEQGGALYDIRLVYIH
jgi:hypothetical protein